MRKVYSVHFIDARDGLPNHKLLKASCSEDIYAYMADLGHTIVEIYEAKRIA